jgi:inorganic pyrophosphatase
MSFKNIPFGTIDEFNVIIEISKGSQSKYEYNEEIDEMELDWVFVNDFCFPYNYGFIPQTKGGDGDPLDAFVISSQPINMGTVVKCRAIGMIELIDRGEKDDKILAIALADPEHNKCQNLEDLPFDYKSIFKEFFDELQVQKNKIMEIKAYRDKDRALKELKSDSDAYM